MQQKEEVKNSDYDKNCEYCDKQIKQESQDESKIEEVKNMNVNRIIKKAILNPVKERIAIAPMVDVTDSYFRFFMRYLSKNAFLYTEMLNEHAILHIEKTGNKRLLDFTPNQHPVVCQIGG